MREFDIGSSIPRVEDLTLLRGRGRYTDDISLVGEARLFILRAPHASARIKRIDTAAAKAAPGIIAVFTAADLAADGVGHVPSRGRRKAPDGKPNFEPPSPALVGDRVAMLGDPVVAVIAETLAQAKDAAELVEIDYEPLPAVTGTAAAVAPGAPNVWPQAPGNVCYVEEIGDKAGVEAAFATAKHLVKQRFVISRVGVHPMEPRAALGHYDEREGRYTLQSGVQMPHWIRQELADVTFKVPATRIRVISPDMGGGFGLRGALYPEHVLVLWASRKLGRAVKWVAERGETFLADSHARDNVSDVTLALDDNGKFLGLRVETLANMGARLSSNGTLVPLNNIGGLAGTYTTPAIHVTVTAVFSNTHPTCPYRGAGRPEASYCIERIIDIAANELNIDRIDLRRRNMIPPSTMPFKTGLVYTYDCGEFEICMDKALAMADWNGALKRQAAARKQGKLYGLGAVSVIEIAGGPSGRPAEEGAEIRFDATGSATLFVGGHNHGQGHETTFRQIAHHALGLMPDRVNVIQGDTDKVFHGRGTFGSRTMSSGGTAVMKAASRVIEKGKLIAAHILEASAADIEFSDGAFKVAGTDRKVGIVEVAKASFVQMRMPPGVELGLGANAIIVPDAANFPNGFHVCEVEIDADSGAVAILRYTVVDDVGVTINPLLLKGQLHGGIAQGVGQALGEQMVYDGGGQLLSGSFMDYQMPRAEDFPSIEVGNHGVPTKANPLGVKGAGEAGCVGALPVVMNAVNDALWPLGIRHFEMPATPMRLWRAIQEAKAK
jgi:aerobic carbon-monoxide dehydrogenase large subunit